MQLIDSAEDSEYMATKGERIPMAVMSFRHLPGLGHRTGISTRVERSLGITRGANKNHIIRATLESIAYQVYDVISVPWKRTRASSWQSLSVDGGASANNFLMQIQADIINAPVKRPECVETTAMRCRVPGGTCGGILER